jgi:hypothetical protein
MAAGLTNQLKDSTTGRSCDTVFRVKHQYGWADLCQTLLFGVANKVPRPRGARPMQRNLVHGPVAELDNRIDFVTGWHGLFLCADFEFLLLYAQSALYATTVLMQAMALGICLQRKHNDH